ncbi:putative Transposon Tf2-1 polyprotein, partial [Rhizoctonia solani 123E]
INNLIGEALYEDPRSREILDSMKHKKTVQDWTLQEGLLWHKGKIFVPWNEKIRNLILESRHDALSAGHPGQLRTLELISRTYWWPSMKKSVKSYVEHCEVCIRSKPTNQLPVGTLKPLPIPERPWEDIAYDLVVGLPQSEGFDAILSVIDHFSKMAHFIPCQETMTSQDLANLFLTYVWKLHRLPRSTVSDRGTVFASKFMRHLYERLDIKPTFSTAYHPQTDGQTERVQQIAEGYIWMFSNHQQDNWASLLPMAEFSYNNNLQTATGKSPFETCYGFSPRMSVGRPKERAPFADEHGQFLAQGYDEVRAALKLSQERMKEFYDRRHRAESEINVGDKVWLNHRNIASDRPSPKLSHKKLGPYLVLEKRSSHAYKLQLPHTMKIHPVFHISLLTKFSEDPHGREPERPLPIVTQEGEEEYEVEEVLDSCKQRRKVEYYVRWKGYGVGDQTWEPAENLENALKEVERFHQRYPRKPRP